MHYRNLEKQKIALLQIHRGNFSARGTLSLASRAELQYWIDFAPTVYKTISHGNPSWTLSTDASKNGWGAYNADSQKRTHGFWSAEELSWSINAKELKAAFLGLQALGGHLTNTHVLILSDNVTTVAYINNMGGVKSTQCDLIACDLWNWCIARQVWISATHIPGRCNVEADRESRKSDQDKEWALHEGVFDTLASMWGKPDIDLFASRINNKVPVYVSWKPDPSAVHINAFTMSWSSKLNYIFPPFSLIGRILQKVSDDQAECLLIVPMWPTAAWFSLIPPLLLDLPVLLPRMQNLLTKGRELHPLRQRLVLIACRLSGNPYRTAKFRRELKTLSWAPGGKTQRANITVIFADGQNFVHNDLSIPFLRL